MFLGGRHSIFQPSVDEDKFDARCFNLIVLDLFFIPLFPLFSVSVSLPIMVLWYINRASYTMFEPERRFFPIVVLFMVLSTIFIFFDYDNTIFDTSVSTSIKRCVQYITSFWYFFFFYYFFVNYSRNVSNLFFYAIVYVTLFAILYLSSPDTFLVIKQKIVPYDPQVNRWLNEELPVYRFNFLWADPNNVAYSVTSMTIFFFNEERHSMMKKFIVLLCLGIILVCTMSIGGMTVAVFVLTIVTIFSLKLFYNGTYSVFYFFLFITFAGIVLIEYVPFIKELFDSGIKYRSGMYEEGGMILGSGGGRTIDLKNSIDKFMLQFLFLGSGHEGFTREIGHVYILYMYGLPVYFFFMYILFWKRKYQSWLEYLAIVPMLVGFTVNIAIGEQKYLIILLLISAYYSAKSYRIQNGF